MYIRDILLPIKCKSGQRDAVVRCESTHGGGITQAFWVLGGEKGKASNNDFLIMTVQ